MNENPIAFAEHAIASPTPLLHGHSLLGVGILGGAIGLGIWGIAKLARKGLEEIGILDRK